MKLRSLLFPTILTVASILPLQAQSTENLSTDTAELKILSWNIYMLPFLSWFNGNGRRAEVIGQKLVDSDYNIIVFQEAFSLKCRRILRKYLTETYPYQYGPTNDSFRPFRSNSGLWVLSKLPLKQLKSIKFKEARGYDAIARKGAVLFEGEHNGKRFQLMATHLQSDKDQDIREKQYKEISQLLAEFYEVGIPQILCGDFNTEMSEKQHYNSMLNTLDAQNGALSGDVQVTYDEINNNLSKQKDGTKGIIDYILTRNTEEITNIKRQVREFHNSDPKYNTYLSDHYAMEAVVTFRNGKMLYAKK